MAFTAHLAAGRRQTNGLQKMPTLQKGVSSFKSIHALLKNNKKKKGNYR